jgi:hypothetical protein
MGFYSLSRVTRYFRNMFSNSVDLVLSTSNSLLHSNGMKVCMNLYNAVLCCKMSQLVYTAADDNLFT